MDPGAQVPGFAETDFALNFAPRETARSTYLNYMPRGASPTLERIVASARAGRSFASNRPHVTIEVDGRPTGSVVVTDPAKVHKLEITAYPAPGEKTLGRIEVVSNHGQVIAAKQNFEGGRLAYKRAGRAQVGYVLVRIFGAEDAPGKPGRYHAVTNPVYLHPAGFRVPRRPTSCRIQVPASSSWLGGALELQDPLGNTLRRHTLRASIIEESVPADTQVVVQKKGLRELRFFMLLGIRPCKSACGP